MRRRLAMIWNRPVDWLRGAAWTLAGKPHLKYRSLWEWLEDRSIPHPVYAIEDKAQRTLWGNRGAELWAHLHQKHLRTLSRAERRQIEAGEHPSQNWKHPELGEPYAGGLQEALTALGFSCSVRATLGQGGLVVLAAELEEEPAKHKRRKLPIFFRGFQVKYLWKSAKNEQE